LVDLPRLTRVTPSTLRRRDISVATESWPVVQPFSSIAGAVIALRTVLPPPDWLEIEPLRLSSVTAAGMAREMSRRACSQSNRDDARSRTVWMRVSAIDWKSTYGFSWATRCVVAAAWDSVASSCAVRSLTVLVVST
jgi:hypothetical protein